MCLWVSDLNSYSEGESVSTWTGEFVKVRASMYVNMDECAVMAENMSN